MIEVVFGIIVLALIGAFVLYVKEVNKEKAKLINALIAKTPQEMRDLSLADQVKIKQSSSPTTPPDLVPIETIPQDDFEEQIKNELK